MRRDERVTDEMVEAAAAAYWMEVYGKVRSEKSGRPVKWPDDVIGGSQELFRDGCRAALLAALSIEQTQPVAWAMVHPCDTSRILKIEHDAITVRFMKEENKNCSFVPLYAHSPVSALVNAQADADVVERWQPIETAPVSNGSETFLAFVPGHGCVVCYKVPGATYSNSNHRRIMKASHWQPLPAPPTTRIADSAEAGGSATLSTGTGGGDGR